MTAATQTVTCRECGAEGQRERLAGTGQFADLAEHFPWTCPTCCARLDAEDAAAEEAAQLKRRDDSSTLPRGLRRDLDELERTPQNTAALDAAAVWAAGDLPGLLLTGPVGGGKTTIGAAAVWRRDLHRRTRWTSVPVLLANALAALDSPTRAEALAAITGHGALALDDIDKVKASSEWASAQLFSAIDLRVVHQAPLLVTMNATPDELAQRIGGDFGDAIASRLVGYCDVIRVTGEDRRLGTSHLRPVGEAA
jgi:DNA replication protein DnaC